MKKFFRWFVFVGCMYAIHIALELTVGAFVASKLGLITFT